MNEYLIPLSEAFIRNSNEQIAFQMKKYMKGQFEYFGIKSPVRKLLKKEFLDQYGLPGNDQLEKIAKEAWQFPQREYQYVIMEILDRMAKKASIDKIDLYEYLLENKSWWDTVDYIAANLVGVHFNMYPQLINAYTGKWMESGNMWLQRTAILFQLKYKKETDLVLLSDYIYRLEGSREFFINKAIGWILREYSKTNPEWVIRFVQNNELANLSKREALKWLDRQN